MAFSQSVIDQAWRRSSGKCECIRSQHYHSGRCNKPLNYANRGKDASVGGWEAHHKTSVASGGSDVLSNCEILCMDCHKKTQTYGG